MTSKLQVLVVEDSVVVREMLIHIINSDPRLHVIAAVASGEAAIKALGQFSPHVISLDIRLPGMDGFETTLQIMTEKPTPIVVISSDIDDRSLNISMNALRAGALAVVEKPGGFASADYQRVATRICDQLVAMAGVKVVRQRFGRDLRLVSASLGPAAPGRAAAAGLSARRELPIDQKFAMLGLVASTGGPNALIQVLQALPKSFALPIAIVQHITDSFLENFAHWLNVESGFTASLVQDRTPPRPGHIHMAPVGHHLTFRGGLFRLTTDAPVSMQRPSGTVLLASLAESLGPRALGVVMTGMGDDGADGLLKMRQAGGYTLAEHRSTAVVYGMPMCAERLGAACEMLPLDQIGSRITELTAGSPGELLNAK